MKMMKKNLSLFVLFFLVILSPLAVSALGLGVPHQFYGTVTYNDQPANNFEISAYVNGDKVGTTFADNGKYGYDIVFFVKDSEGTFEGETIEFYINGIDTGITAIFVNGGSTELNLYGTGPSEPVTPVIPPTTPPTGGSGGGGGGGGTSYSSSSSSDNGDDDVVTSSTSSTSGGAVETPENKNSASVVSKTSPFATARSGFAAATGALIIEAFTKPDTLILIIGIVLLTGLIVGRVIVRKKYGK